MRAGCKPENQKTAADVNNFGITKSYPQLRRDEAGAELTGAQFPSPA